MKIEGATVFITGANRGIGAALTKVVRAAGAKKIYAAMRKPRKSDAADGVETLSLDITDESQVAAAAARCQDVDILINNAGVAAFVPLLTTATTADARTEMEINYFGTLFMCRAFAPILKQNGGGALVNVLSTASWVGVPMQGSYCASKAAAWALTNAIRFELRSQGTCVSGVFVGYVDTDMTAGIPDSKVTPLFVAEQIAKGIGCGDEEILVDDRAKSLRSELLNNYGPFNQNMQKVWEDLQANGGQART